jgi:hypothetical protein
MGCNIYKVQTVFPVIAIDGQNSFDQDAASASARSAIPAYLWAFVTTLIGVLPGDQEALETSRSIGIPTHL